MTDDDAYELHRENRTPRCSHRGWKSKLDRRLEALTRSIAKGRDVGAAIERCRRYQQANGLSVNLTHVEKTLLYAMR